jgi:hypothetical protein
LKRPHSLERALSGSVDMTWTDLPFISMRHVVQEGRMLTMVHWAVSSHAASDDLGDLHGLHREGPCLRLHRCAFLFVVCDRVGMRRGSQRRGQWVWAPTLFWCSSAPNSAASGTTPFCGNFAGRMRFVKRKMCARVQSCAHRDYVEGIVFEDSDSLA